ncbi:MAG: hypothetical protein H7641_12915 [Candidatus Heimdallarchaeota archaeon]|nr:hypothetical protein [Candidatus Heimdallarchaeota archaeon]MCK4878462.1 hypothetical protein [Candidatus Heimdallarchaeota archaeon]
MSIEDVINKIDNIESDNDLAVIEKIIRVIASNHRTLEIYELCEKVIEKCLLLDNKRLLVNLYGYQISIIYNFKNKICIASRLINKMIHISNEIKYEEGSAWAYSYIWYIEKYNGNKRKSVQALNKTIGI